MAKNLVEIEGSLFDNVMMEKRNKHAPNASKLIKVQGSLSGGKRE